MTAARARGRARAVAAAARRSWPSGPAGRVLAAIIIGGIALRLLVIVSWWPVTPTLEDGYQRFVGNPFADPQHPAGYGFIVSILGDVSRQIAFTVLVQHLVGILSALLMGAAVRRVSGSAWAALLPTAVMLLGPDFAFLEHSIMSESWAVFTLSLSFYAVVRAGETPRPVWRWPLIAGVALAAAVLIRTAAIPLIAVVAVALLIWPSAGSQPRTRAKAAGVTVLTVASLLVAFAGASALSGHRFGIEPSPGWYLYGRVAQFANCRTFTPPAGTRSLCETRPPSTRPSGYVYTFEPSSPAIRQFGAFGRDDGVVGAWARRALKAQFGDFLGLAWTYLRSYYIPGTLPHRLAPTTTGLDPQLDFTNRGNAIVVAAMHQDLESYYDAFTVTPVNSGLDVLRVWQQVIRFGATALFITTILSLIGLLVGPPATRVGVLLFGGGGLSLLLAPVLTGTYAGRYTVPIAGPMAAAAALSILQLVRIWRRSRADARADADALAGHPRATPSAAG